jgi:hypothetical protein
MFGNCVGGFLFFISKHYFHFCYIHVFNLCFVVHEDNKSETESDFDQAIESVHDESLSVQVPQEKQQPKMVHR